MQSSIAAPTSTQFAGKNQVYNNQGILIENPQSTSFVGNQQLGSSILGTQQSTPILQQGWQSGAPIIQQQGWQSGAPILQQGWQGGSPILTSNPLAHVATGAPIMINPKLRSVGNLHTAPGKRGAGLYGHTQQWNQAQFAQQQLAQQQGWSVNQQWGQGQLLQQPVQIVQPIIHREVEAPAVHVIEQHIYESVAPTGPGVITRAPIIQETVRPRIIEEVQPILHREIAQPFVEVVEQHVTEHVVQPTITTKQVLNESTLQQTSFQQTGLQQPGLQQGSNIPIPPPLPNQTSQRGGFLSRLRRNRSSTNL